MARFNFLKLFCSLFIFSLVILGYAQSSQAQHDFRLLKAELSKDVSAQTPLATLLLKDKSLTAGESDEIEGLIWKAYVAQQKASRLKEHKSGVLSHGDLKMPFYYLFIL